MSVDYSTNDGVRVALFVTCLVNIFRPQIGFCCLGLVNSCGYNCEVPSKQVCCGQPAYNAGDWKTASTLALRCMEVLQDYHYIVIPSGSCAGMMRYHYPLLFKGDEKMTAKAKEFASKIYELSEFLDKSNITFAPSKQEALSVTYHDSCSCLRELGVRETPRELLRSMEHIKLIEHDAQEDCCGFGGLFCVKYSAISAQMTDKKVDSLAKTGVQLLTSSDLGCLLNIAGAMKKRKIKMQVRHIAELLVGDTKKPSII